MSTTSTQSGGRSATRGSTRGDVFTISIEGRTIAEGKAVGAVLLTKVRLGARRRAERSWTVGGSASTRAKAIVTSNLNDTFKWKPSLAHNFLQD